MGVNGSGKSTLFNLISGFLEKEEGSIVFNDVDLQKSKPHEIASMGVSRTFQDLRLIPTLSVYENILLAFKEKRSEQLLHAFRVGKESDCSEKIEEILALTHLESEKDSKAEDISYGQQKLLNLAVALANDFELLLLDEPVAGVQPEFREQILQLIKSFGKTVIVIEHNPEFLEKLTESILFLDGGKVIAEGNYTTIKENQRVQEAYL